MLSQSQHLQLRDRVEVPLRDPLLATQQCGQLQKQQIIYFPSNLDLQPWMTVVFQLRLKDLMVKIETILMAASNDLTNDVLLSIDLVAKEESPTQMYQYGRFINLLGVVSKGHMGSTYFYFGINDANINGVNYGLANIAIFLFQAAVEMVTFDICNEVSCKWNIYYCFTTTKSSWQQVLQSYSQILHLFYQKGRKMCLESIQCQTPVGATQDCLWYLTKTQTSALRKKHSWRVLLILQR